jgi:hypothetical protein
VLPDAGKFPAFRRSSSSRTQTSELPHCVNMRLCGSAGTVLRLAACCIRTRGTAVTALLIPPGPAPYGWCQDKEA